MESQMKAQSGAAPIRNLQIISSPGVGGREIVAPTLARQLQAQGHPTWLMCRPGTLVERLGRDWGLTVIPTGMRGYCDPGPIGQLARFLRRERIQVVHAHWSKDLSNLLLASALAGGVPVVLTKHVYATESKRDPFHDWIYRKTAAVIAVSELVAENVARTTATPRERIVTIYNGLDLRESWDPGHAGKNNLRGEWHVPAGAPIVGFAGRLNQGKGPHWVLEAFQRLAEKYAAWHLVFAGRAVGEQEEAYAEGLRRRVNESGLSGRVHFAGFRPDMPAAMKTFDILVCPSEFESLGMVVAEAMAMERPVVGTDAGGIPEMIRHGVNGVLFRRGDIGDLTAQIESLMADPERRKKMGREGRRIVLDRFDLECMAERVAGVFRAVIQARAAGRRARFV